MYIIIYNEDYPCPIDPRIRCEYVEMETNDLEISLKCNHKCDKKNIIKQQMEEI